MEASAEAKVNDAHGYIRFCTLFRKMNMVFSQARIAESFIYCEQSKDTNRWSEGEQKKEASMVMIVPTKHGTQTQTEK